jgi:hypothetical protein
MGYRLDRPAGKVWTGMFAWRRGEPHRDRGAMEIRRRLSALLNETAESRNGRVYSCGAAQVKFAASLCAPVPEKCATAG